MPTPAKAFAEQYRSFTEDELLQLALDRRDLLPAASAALEAELAARGLGDEAIQNFRDRLRTPAEDEHDSLQQGPPPPPTDLPENRFDEKSDDSRSSSLQCRASPGSNPLGQQGSSVALRATPGLIFF